MSGPYLRPHYAPEHVRAKPGPGPGWAPVRRGNCERILDESVFRRDTLYHAWTAARYRLCSGDGSRGFMSETSAQPDTTGLPRPSDHPAVAAGGIGVLLVNLGTPEATDAGSVRRYLSEFLADKRVIEQDSLLWKLVLNGYILRFRPRRKGRDYEKIWNREKNESPLKTITRAQAEKLSSILEPLGRHVAVGLGDALRPSVDRLAARRAGGQGLRAHPAGAALSAILRGDDRDRVRRGFSGPHENALAAGAARGAALFRRSGLYRCGGEHAGNRAHATAVPARRHPGLLPRRPEGVPRSRAIPIIATAPRPRGCCASGSNSTTGNSG